MYNLKFDKKAAKYLKSLDKPTRNRIIQAFEELAENPFSDLSVKRMKGYVNMFRKRVGHFRIIYEIDQGERTCYSRFESWKSWRYLQMTPQECVLK